MKPVHTRVWADGVLVFEHETARFAEVGGLRTFKRWLGGIGGVNLATQTLGTVSVVALALVTGGIVYGVIHKLLGLRLSQEEEFDGADLSIHRIQASPEREASW